MKSLFITCIIAAFFSPFKNNSYQVECISTSSEGSVVMKIWDAKKGNKYKLDQAKIDAIHSVLYSGISSSNGCIPQKPILSSQEDISKFKKIEKAFFGRKGTWLKYVRTSTTESTLPDKIGEKNWTVYQIAVAKDLLRKDLIELKIIKSLNNGF